LVLLHEYGSHKFWGQHIHTRTAAHGIVLILGERESGKHLLLRQQHVLLLLLLLLLKLLLLLLLIKKMMELLLLDLLSLNLLDNLLMEIHAR